MKREMCIILIGIIGIIVLVLAGWYVMFVHFGRGSAFPFLPTVELGLEGAQTMPFADSPLMAVVDTEEEARKIAELYGITFVSYENGIAVYQTDEDPMQVIARGQENDYPRLSLNLKRELYIDGDNGNVTLFRE